MNRKQWSCYLLLASAVLLAAILVVQLNERVAPAQAEMVLGRNSLTMMTAKTADNEEALFVLDSSTQRLVIYTTDLRGAKGTVEPQEVVDLNAIFNTGGGSGARNTAPSRGAR